MTLTDMLVPLAPGRPRLPHALADGLGLGFCAYQQEPTSRPNAVAYALPLRSRVEANLGAMTAIDSRFPRTAANWHQNSWAPFHLAAAPDERRRTVFWKAAAQSPLPH